ncbi:hypothetical protein BCF74_10382 [Knoellia remsis]|uniref:Uncharacterized protein n=1 Tax=Knoellia remsis TaxID=407159 RepID=A0A2T0UY66_9MICO|nr:hypothetical protein [Knoellia remsis]PRY62875.1 hypothetical protein BCF74_10382 [Knoellia remsis]
MPTLAKRVVGGVLAVLGLVLTVIGLWYATHLGGSGTATFTANPTATNPVLVPQTVLNRTDDLVTVRATPVPGGTVWMAAASPSDAEAVVGKTAHTTVTGVDTRPWELRTETGGSGATPPLSGTDVWRNTVTGEAGRAATMTIEQSNAPETVIVQAAKGGIQTIELTWERKSWFLQAVILALVGLFLLLSGASLLWSARPRRTTTTPEHSA